MTSFDHRLPAGFPRGQLLYREAIIGRGVPSWLIDELVQDADWGRLLPEIYFSGPLPTGPEPLAHLRIQAAAMWARDGSAIGGAAAAWWHGWLHTPPVDVEVHIAQNRKLSPQQGFRIHRTAIEAADLTEYRGIVTTAAPRTALDLAAHGSTDLLDTMLRQNWFDQVALDAALVRGAGRRGWIRARESLAECEFRPFSQAERRVHRGLRTEGIDGWVANPRIAIGNVTIIPDLLFEEARLVVEIDGHEHHSDRAAFESDRHRQNLLVAAGYRVLRFTWRQLVEDLDGVIRAIVAELQRSAA